MYYPLLAEKTRYFKESEEGVAIMCKAIEDMRNEARAEGIAEGIAKEKKESIIRMLTSGVVDVEFIAKMLDCPISLIADVQNELRQAAQ